MHQSAKKITTRILSELESGQPYYTVSDLESTSLPSSVCKQIQIAIAGKIQEDITQPKTAWANTESEQIQMAWKKLQEEINRRAHIRSGRLKGFLEEVIQSLLEVYIEPRKHMADAIFGTNSSLGYYELEQRVSKLTVNKHFGTAILKYMQKRGLQSLSKEKCSLLVKTLDDNLASSYSIEEWEQVLSLLFHLFWDEVDAKLLARFFADKGRTDLAQIFGGMNEPVSRQKFQEVMENPEAFHKADPSKEKTQADLFVEDKDDGDSSLVNQFMETPEEESAQVKDEDNEDFSFNALFKTEEEQEVFFDHFDEPVSEATEFKVTAPGADLDSVEDEDIPEEEEQILTFEEETEADINTLFQEEDVDEPTDEEAELTPDPEEDSPMWAQFLDPDEVRQEETEEDSFAHEDFVEDIFGEEGEQEDEPPIYFAETISLKEHLKEKESEYVALIFKGAKQKYASAMEDIQEFENWDDASDYIQAEVFTRNAVDMFSDVAVDFTDQLQSYFDEYKS